MIIQFTGLSGAGKTTLANTVKKACQQLRIYIIDADEFRKTICKDLGFTKTDRVENIRRLGYHANKKSKEGFVVIIAAINPYQEARDELIRLYEARTVWIKCSLKTVIKRDTKGLYKKASLPVYRSERIANLTGFNDPYEEPSNPDLVIETDKNDIITCAAQLAWFIGNQSSLHG